MNIQPVYTDDAMIHTKIITVGLDTSDPISLFHDGVLMSIMQKKYEGICFAKCYIKRVIEILDTSDCIINKEGMPDFGTMSIKFLAEVVEFACGEIINGCVVNTHDNLGYIVCSTEYASIIINDMDFESIQPGQIISVVVAMTQYVIGARTVSIMGRPFVMEQTVTVYKYAPISDDSVVEIYKLIKEEESACAQLREGPRAKQFATISQLLYAYQEPQDTPRDVVEIDIRALTKAQSHYVSRDPRIGARGIVYGYTKPPEGAVIDETIKPPAVAMIMLRNYYDYLRSIREMMDIYNTGELLKSHANLWRIYKKAKGAGGAGGLRPPTLHHSAGAPPPTP